MNCAKLVVLILSRFLGPADPTSGFLVSTGSFRAAARSVRPLCKRRGMSARTGSGPARSNLGNSNNRGSDLTYVGSLLYIGSELGLWIVTGVM